MYATHIHLLLNHFPIVGTLIGTGVLAFGLLSRNRQVVSTAMGILLIMAVLAIPVFLSGGSAEDTVEDLAGVSETYIELHEEWAEKAIWLMGALGILSFAGIVLIWRRARIVTGYAVMVLLMAAGTFGVMAKVGNLGGQIRHSEIRKPASPSPEGDDSYLQMEEPDDD